MSAAPGTVLSDPAPRLSRATLHERRLAARRVGGGGVVLATNGGEIGEPRSGRGACRLGESLPCSAQARARGMVRVKSVCT